MFGFRSDGRRLNKLDPMLLITPYIMPMRIDAQNMITQNADYDAMANYIKKQRENGRTISFMTIVIATYVRTVAMYPFLNRFVVNKQIYARDRISVSFVVCCMKEDGSHDAPTIKLEFDPTETIFEISDKIEAAIAEARANSSANSTMAFASALMSIPFLPTIVVAVAKFLDRYGLLPQFIHDISPFHTSMFITNMASLGLSSLYHHIYNFGTTSQFVSLGKIERIVIPGANKTVKFKNVLPMGIVTDERVCGGADYAQVFATMRGFFSNPELLETPPEKVNWDIDFTERTKKRREKEAKAAAKRAAKQAKKTSANA
ncbi:MAG: hypothetical protein E7335_05905 [Clostridiales bacterium]|nr:hypothetical protein [Clostridiales bacterium]